MFELEVTVFAQVPGCFTSTKNNNIESQYPVKVLRYKFCKYLDINVLVRLKNSALMVLRDEKSETQFNF